MAKFKICLDAGHFGKYNQSPANTAYYESVMNWKLHMLLKEELVKYGFEVITTRSSQAKDLSLSKRGAKSKGCDLFLSIHSNAVGSGVNEKVDYPVVYVPLSGKGDILGKKLAEVIADTMDTDQNGRIAKRKSSSGGEYYSVIRGAVEVGTVGMILEHSFHTNTRSTNWLMNNSNLEKLAKAEAKVIAEYYGVKSSTATTTVKSTYGIVEVTYEGEDGLNVRTAPDTKSDVNKVAKKGDKFIAVGITSDNNWYKLITGEYISASTRYVKFTKNVELKVRVNIDDLNIRTGAGTNYVKTGDYTGKGVFTIVEVREGSGSDAGWGRLKSGAGWISLDYCEVV